MAMNIFRLIGDYSHLAAIFLLIRQLQTARNARGISLKTQELYLLVFVTRYLDLFTTFYSLYNTLMKIIFVSTTLYTICMIRFWEPIQSVYNHNQDCFPHVGLAVLPCAVLAVCIHLARDPFYFDTMELLWTFSILLESIAILPQLATLRKYGLVENLTGNFVLFMGVYRLLYIFNWIYRAHTERGYRHHYLVYICGVIQVLMYTDFFLQYLRGTRVCSDPASSDSVTDDTAGSSDTTEGLLFESSRKRCGNSIDKSQKRETTV
eukprot:CAMPEP_0168724930 /NCGR_PEP_ID=MMETSP0724-20121128/3888_1 /TAXON_ID=265536 /ORGANISM="Amphiprora sp., Strain CCMP467" /LENGTH=263 /DNA_ID=CAMNT_0008771691 /DNA_START=30 /DNA_END=821 /DNA_ORIENTATION=-